MVTVSVVAFGFSDGTIPISSPECDCFFTAYTGQAHVFHHICRLMPDIKKVKLYDGSPDEDLSDLPKVCPAVEEWYRSPEAEDWVDIIEAPIEPHVETFLEGFMEAKQIIDLPDFWDSCFDLEISQRRIQELGMY